MALIELTPGPNMAYLAMVGVRWGRRAGFVTIAGITCGLAIYLLATVVGLGGLILGAPWCYAALRWAGVGYLLWIAFETWRGGAGASPGQPPPQPGRRRLFTRGLLANLLNAKAAVFYIALLPGFTSPRWGDPGAQALSLGLIHIGVSLIIHTVIVLAAGGAGRRVEAWASGASRRRVDHLLACGLVAVAIWLAWQTSQPV